MTTDCLTGALDGANAGALNDCWNRIGTWGNRQCPVLKGAIHCRNCSVYSSAATRRLEEELPPGYLDRWTDHFAVRAQPTDQPSQNILRPRLEIR
jgi:chemotaxis-related protein WspD